MLRGRLNTFNYCVENANYCSATSFRDRMGQGVLSKVKPALLKPYMMKRDDYVTEGIEKIVSLSKLMPRMCSDGCNSSPPNNGPAKSTIFVLVPSHVHNV